MRGLLKIGLARRRRITIRHFAAKPRAFPNWESTKGTTDSTDDTDNSFRIRVIRNTTVIFFASREDFFGPDSQPVDYQ
jgi:hypothetical protein